MKIVKRVGERLLPYWSAAELRPVLAFAGAGAALWAGSCELVRRGWNALGEHLNIWERLGALAFAGYVLAYTGLHAPRIAHFAIPIALLAWCVAALCVAPPTARDQLPEEDAKTGSDTTAEPRGEAWRAFVTHAIGDRQGVHLRDLLDGLHQTGHHPDWEVADVKRVCEAAGIPVRPRVRVRGMGVTVGVHRDDLPPLPEPSPESGGQEPPNSELHVA